MTRKFQVGDRVECHYYDGTWDGELGTVVFVSAGGKKIAVELDMFNVCKHSCGGHAANGHGWWYLPNHLKLIEESCMFNVEDLI